MDSKTIIQFVGAFIIYVFGMLLIKHREGDFDPYACVTARPEIKYSKLKKLLLVFYYERVIRILEVLIRPFVVTVLSFLIIFLIILYDIYSRLGEQRAINLIGKLILIIPYVLAIITVSFGCYIKYLQSKLKH